MTIISIHDAVIIAHLSHCQTKKIFKKTYKELKSRLSLEAIDLVKGLRPQWF